MIGFEIGVVDATREFAPVYFAMLASMLACGVGIVACSLGARRPKTRRMRRRDYALSQLQAPARQVIAQA